MRRVLTALAFATIAGALVFGAAAALDVGSNNLGSGSDTVAACDTTDGDVDGSNIDVAYDLVDSDPQSVEAVIVSDIDAACDTQDIYVVVSDGGTPLGSGSHLGYDHTTDAGTVTVTLSTSASAEAIDGVAVTITGTPPSP